MYISLITNVWIVDSGNCIINRQYNEEDKILNDFIIAMFSVTDSTLEDNNINHNQPQLSNYLMIAACTSQIIPGSVTSLSQLREKWVSINQQLKPTTTPNGSKLL